MTSHSLIFYCNLVKSISRWLVLNCKQSAAIMKSLTAESMPTPGEITLVHVHGALYIGLLLRHLEGAYACLESYGGTCGLCESSQNFFYRVSVSLRDCLAKQSGLKLILIPNNSGQLRSSLRYYNDITKAQSSTAIIITLLSWSVMCQVGNCRQLSLAMQFSTELGRPATSTEDLYKAPCTCMNKGCVSPGVGIDSAVSDSIIAADCLQLRTNHLEIDFTKLQ